MDKEKLKNYYEIFTVAWQLFRKYANTKKDEDWDKLISEATEIRKKYPGEFSRKILMETLNEIERVNK